VAALLELAHAARAAQVVALDLVLAVRAELVVERHEAGLGGLHLELSQAHVVEVFRRTDDRVDDRAHEREQRGDRRARDEHQVVDAPARVGERPEHEREPDDDEHEDEDVDGRVERVVVDAEDAEQEHGERAEGTPGRRPLEEHPAQSVAEGEEHEDRQRHHDGHQRDHSEHAGTAVVHSTDALRRPADTRSATR
jgi:hypothetical protein